MKTSLSLFVRTFALAAIALFQLNRAQASSYTWDSDAVTAGVQDGIGTWGTANANWLLSGADPDVGWVPGSDAVFGGTSGTAGTVTLTNAVIVSNLTFNAAFAGNYNISGATLFFTNNPSLTVNAGGDVSIASNLRGNMGFTKRGSGTLTLTPGTANVYTGLVEVANGTLINSGSTAKQTIGPDGLLIDAGATFQYASGKIASIAPGACITNNGGTILWGSTESNVYALNTVVLANNGVISNFTSSDRTMQVSNLYLVQSGTISYSYNNNTNKALILSGAGGMLKTTAGTVTIAGTNGTQVKNNYLGVTTISGGILNISRDLAIGTNPPAFSTNQLTLDGGTLQIALSYAWGTNRGVYVTANGGGLDTMSGVSQTVPVPIDGAAGGNLTKTGNGTLTLTGTNTYAGGTVINGGILALSGNGSIANSSGITVAGNATFDISALATSLTLGNSQALKASSNTNSGTIATGASANLALGASSPLQFTAFNGSTAPLAISGAGTLSLAAGNNTTVTVANGGSALGAGDYKLISKGASGGVIGTAPTSVTVNGDGATGAASLAITSGELFLHVGSGGGGGGTTNHVSYSSGTAFISIAGIPSTPYVLYSATDVHGPYLPVQTNTTDGAGFLTFTNASANPQQFYRTAH